MGPVEQFIDVRQNQDDIQIEETIGNLETEIEKLEEQKQESDDDGIITKKIEDLKEKIIKLNGEGLRGGAKDKKNLLSYFKKQQDIRENINEIESNIKIYRRCLDEYKYLKYNFEI